jgi:hypothetical protein
LTSGTVIMPGLRLGRIDLTIAVSVKSRIVDMSDNRLLDSD